MANLFDTLRIGGNSLSAQQVAAQVVGTNISSASVDGYHRQSSVFHSMNQLGGIRDVTVDRATDQFLEAQVNSQTAAYEFANKRSEGLSLILDAVGTMDESGLNASVSDFFASWRSLNVYPEDLTSRRDVLVKGQLLTERVSQSAVNLKAAQKLADDDIVHSLDAINASLQGIARLNRAIGEASALNQPDNSLRDQQDLAIKKLNELVDVTKSVEPDGHVTVLLGNISVVSQDKAYTIFSTVDPDTGLHHLAVDGTTQGVIDGRIAGGAIGAKIATRDTDVPRVLATLDQFAYDLGSSVNALHAAGYGLDGQNGRSFFALPPSANGASTTFAVSDDIAGRPALLAAAQVGTAVPGDSSNALAIVDLEQLSVCSAGTETPSNAVARIVSDAGQALALTRGDRERTFKHREQLTQLFEEQNGVSMDEQMMQLTRIQNAYMASAKLVGVVERMLDTLQNL